jgi:UDP-N-acetylmuramoyl-L-alanyl-D-glutamate--2,6-diaminopimelate ligase
VGIVRTLKNLTHLFEAVVARLYFGFPGKKLIVIGVTGTDGKTTTTNLIHHILTTSGFKTAVLSTLSSAHTTTPGAWKLQKFLAQSLKNNCTHVVLEVSSHAIDQNRVWGIPFVVGVLTNIADNEHLDYHKTFENYKNTKLKWLNTCKNKVDLTDSTNLKNLKRFKFETKLIGEFNKLNVLGAVGVGRILDIDDEVIRRAVASFEPPAGRLEVVVKKPFTVIVDFAHTPQAFERVLPVVKKLGKKLIHVFGCTGDRDKGKRPIMGEIASKFDDIIILTTEDTYLEDPERIVDGVESGIRNHELGKGYFRVPNRREAIGKALQVAQKGDVVMITGVGHQKSLNIGGKEIPWSDQRVVIEEMENVARSSGVKE